jgi:hypothetical protein
MSLAAFTTACDDGVIEPDLSPGTPQLEVSAPTAANFGDNIPFSVTVSDNVPLSVVTAQLFFGEEEMNHVTLRTREAGTYTGSLFAPFLPNIPDGNATLRFTMTDTHLSKATQEVSISLTRAQYPYLIFVTADAAYQMLPTGAPNEYAATDYFPSTDLPGYIKTPVLTDHATEVTFGWEGGVITQGSTTDIPFVSPVGGEFSITFNTLTYAAAPFFEILVNDTPMTLQDKTHYQIDLDLTQGTTLTVEGIEDLATWWIDPDFLTQTAVGKYTFVPLSGRYRLIADLTLKFFRIYSLNGNDPAVLDVTTGEGAVWVIGDNVGKPTVAGNVVGWSTEKALCMAPVAAKKYRITLVAGQQVDTHAINFKFFHQMGWGGEFGANLTSTSDVVQVGAGQEVNGHDAGNLFLPEGTILEAGATYLFTIDLTAGINAAVLTVEKMKDSLTLQP